MPRKYTVDFTFGELTKLVEVVRGTIDESNYALSVDYIGPETELTDWRVKDAESRLIKRAERLALLATLTGDAQEEDPEIIARVAAARRRYDAEEADRQRETEEVS